ncbi:hypothetical protein F2Q69_00024404 [Brassica cretica]|uniref:Uncharacterized protein n=1 Tax=Brassica cretica TaxID=69181 RepID=A0A8S9Q1K4_BRACR|nr:hypothetical protein F2Q69_00024404 [Brassica cretica]
MNTTDPRLIANATQELCFFADSTQSAISKLHERKLKANDLKYRQRLIRKGIPPVLREKTRHRLGMGSNMYPSASASLLGNHKDKSLADVPVEQLIENADVFAAVFPGKWGCYVGCLVYWAWLYKAQAGNICVAAFDSTCSGICRSADPIVEVNMQCVDLEIIIWKLHFEAFPQHINRP